MTLAYFMRYIDCSGTLNLRLVIASVHAPPLVALTFEALQRTRRALRRMVSHLTVYAISGSLTLLVEGNRIQLVR